MPNFSKIKKVILNFKNLIFLKIFIIKKKRVIPMNHSLKILLWKEKKGKKLKKPTLLFFSFLVKDYSALRAKKQPSTKGNISLTPSQQWCWFSFSSSITLFLLFLLITKSNSMLLLWGRKLPKIFLFATLWRREKIFPPLSSFFIFSSSGVENSAPVLKNKKTAPLAVF